MKLYGGFEKNGYAIQVHMPTSDPELPAFEVRILIHGEVRKTLLVPLLYLPTLCVDTGDHQRLESILDKMMELLPATNRFNEQTICPLDELEAKIGGARLRAKRARQELGTGEPEPFEHTGEFFADAIGDLLDSRDTTRRWMHTKLAKLDNRTPEEALHLGMAPEVLNLVESKFPTGGI